MFYIAFIIIIFLYLLIAKITIKINVDKTNINISIIIMKVIKINLVDKTKKDNKTPKSLTNIRKYKDSFYNKPSSIPKVTMFIKAFLKELLKKLSITVDFKLRYGLSSPDMTAISYGIINALIYNADSVLMKSLSRFKRKYSIIPDMKKQNMQYSIKASVTFRIIVIIPLIIKLFMKLKNYIQLPKGKDDIKNGRTSHRKLNEDYNG